MSLTSAHAGYAYQDLFCAYIILEEVLSENDSIITIDEKEINDDRFDDIVIRNERDVFRKQIKYSDSKDHSHVLTKDDLANDSGYNLAIHKLFESWKSYPENDKGHLHLCLSWGSPSEDDKLLDILVPQNTFSSFTTFSTIAFSIDVDKLWPIDDEPNNSWRKFRKESTSINRKEFQEFINSFLIEVCLPKASLNIQQPGELEYIMLEEVIKLGAGEYPNENIRPEEIVLLLTEIVRRSRARGTKIVTSEILKELRIRTDFGRIEQSFPVDSSKLVVTDFAIDKVVRQLESNSKIVISGEPGAGKSWFINNLETALEKKYRFAKHYCYTDLKDSLQLDRIKLNTFYGNLIAEVLEHFPNLREKKRQRWASNLNELNILLSYVPDKLILLVDGLDHINRIYELKKGVLSKQEVNILKAINEIEITNDKVKIIVLSQPIKELEEFTDFQILPLPKWSQKEIESLLQANRVDDLELEKGITLVSFLVERCNGNPLYLSYLLEELKQLDNISVRHLNNLPSYSYNLSNYYEYLLTRLNENSKIPHILCGANFFLSKIELEEITKSGLYVKEDLSSLLPILKINHSTGGFSIYHESFRRFIISKLIANKVDIWENIFKPLAFWFENKGFYEYYKSSKYYFALLYENEKEIQLAEFIDREFIKKCLYYGHSWDLIIDNFKYLALSCSSIQKFDKAILISEQSRILASVEDEYKIGYNDYFNALGSVRGFEVAAKSLIYDGEPTIEFDLGLNACTICELNGVQAPWNTYIELKNKDSEIELEEFGSHIIYLISNRKYGDLEHIAKQLKDLPEFLDLFINNINKWISIRKDDSWLEETPKTKRILFKTPKRISKKKLVALRDTILDSKNFRSDRIATVKDYFDGVDFFISESKYGFIYQLIEQFKSINWFYNWLIYYSKLKIFKAEIQSTKEYSYKELKEVFNYLVYDTDPFKGEVRTIDLYNLRKVIHQSIDEGLKTVRTIENRNAIVELLKKVSEETTRTIQNSPGGPLTPDSLLEIIKEYDSKDEIDNTITHYLGEIEFEKQYRYYQTVASQYFRLATLYSKKSNLKKAKKAFKKGIKYLLSYTMRKDTTLGELIDSIESLHSCSPKLGEKYIRKLKTLSDTVVNHTDGKTTKWYPIYWYEKYNVINRKGSILYLAFELSQTRFDWRLEENLKHLLIALNGELCSHTELFIARTFPIEDSEKFLNNALELCNKTDSPTTSLSVNSTKLFLSKLHLGRNTNYKEPFKKKVEDLAHRLRVSLKQKPESDSTTYNNKRGFLKNIKNNFHYRAKSFSSMTDEEFVAYLEGEHISIKDSMGIFLRLDKINSKEIKKDVIELLAGKNRHLSEDDNEWVEQLFQDESDDSIYYYTSKFAYQRSDWFESFDNIELFQTAYKLNPRIAIKHLFSLISKKISGAYYTHKVSANLVNTLVAVGYPNTKVVKLWNTLYDIIDDRLSGKEEYNWKELDNNELASFSEKELLIVILLNRLKSNSSERHHWVVSGLSSLLITDPKALVKPLRWFFKSSSSFLEICLLSILQVIYEYTLNDIEYGFNFKKELLDIYPSSYFLIDWLIEQLLLLPTKRQLIESEQIFYPIDKEEISFFNFMNLRHNDISNLGIDLGNTIGEFNASFRNQFQDFADLYYSRINKMSIKNTFAPNYILKLINERHYNEFRELEFHHGKNLYGILALQNKQLIAQYSSTTCRPLNLEKTHDRAEGFSISSTIPIVDGWIRLGLYEQELYQESYPDDFKRMRIFGSVVFGSDEKVSEFPFSRYRLMLNKYWYHELLGSEKEIYTTLIELQEDDFYESLKLLWLHPFLFSYLKLSICDYKEGLYATDENNDVVLKYNAWIAEYMEGDMFSDEIPKLNGAELLIREDYFQKVCELYGGIEPRICLNVQK